jgi:hypothetical protein
MCANAVRGKLKAAGILSVIIMTLAAFPAEAQAQNNRSFTLAGRQLLLIERMTNSALLAALGIDASPRLRSIHWSRDRFDRMQTELREGDPYIGLSPTTKPEVLVRLDRADLRWQQYETIFGEIVTSASVSKAQIRVLTASHAETIEALSQMVDSYKYFVHGGDYHSIMSSAINRTGQLRAGTQLVLRGLLMTVYYGYGVQERELLVQLTRDFDRTMNGLIHGDSELRLLPAATGEIRAELMKVDQMWSKVQRIVESAAAGEDVTNDQIATVAQHANDMAVPLTMALIMYLSI